VKNFYYKVAELIKEFKQFMKENWHHVAIQEVKTNGKSDMFVGNDIQIEAIIKLGPISREKVIVEIVYGKENGNELENINTIYMENVEKNYRWGLSL